MARKTAQDGPRTLALAQRLQAALAGPSGFMADAPVERPGGIIEPTAHFDVRDAEGRVYRVLVARQH